MLSRVFQALLAAALLGGILSGCTFNGARRPSSEDLHRVSGQMLEERKAYADNDLVFKLPTAWTAGVDPVKDSNIHAVTVACPAELHAHITLLRRSPGVAAFPAEVVKALRGSHPELTREPFRARYADCWAHGFRYVFQQDQRIWEGWVVSATYGSSELGYLGQYPQTSSSELQEALEAIMNSLTLKNPSAPGP